MVQHLLSVEDWLKLRRNQLSYENQLRLDHPEAWDDLFAWDDDDRYQTLAQNIEICKGGALDINPDGSIRRKFFKQRHCQQDLHKGLEATHFILHDAELRGQLLALRVHTDAQRHFSIVFNFGPGIQIDRASDADLLKFPVSDYAMLSFMFVHAIYIRYDCSFILLVITET